MNYKCETCLDTGSIKGELYLDCTSCDVAKERADLHAYLAKNQFMHPHELAWLVHQRALAMAPKQEAIKVADERAAFDAWYDVTPSRQAHAWDAWKHRASIAAPAAANGALTDERAAFEADTLDLYPSAKFNRFPSGTYTDSFIETQWGAWQRRSKFAAAGPDAALVKALTKCVQAIAGVHMSYNSELGEARRMALAALSGAKGN